MNTYDLRANYYALFISIVKNCTATESLMQLGVSTKEIEEETKTEEA